MLQTTSCWITEFVLIVAETSIFPRDRDDVFHFYVLALESTLNLLSDTSDEDRYEQIVGVLELLGLKTRVAPASQGRKCIREHVVDAL